MGEQTRASGYAGTLVKLMQVFAFHAGDVDASGTFGLTGFAFQAEIQNRLELLISDAHVGELARNRQS